MTSPRPTTRTSPEPSRTDAGRAPDRGPAGDLPGPILEYGVALERWPQRLRERFVQLGSDDGTRAYLERARRARHGRFRTWLHRRLRRRLSDFDVNGLLNMYPMHLLSTAQWRALLGGERVHHCLDVGAGSGDVTVELAPLCDRIRATESSRAMSSRLADRGIACDVLDACTSALPEAAYDLVACLNVLDRCARPLELLANVRRALAPGGRLVVAVPLPYRPFFYAGPATPAPQERLDCDVAGWEEAAARLVERHLEPLGIAVQAITRVPYLSGGDAEAAWYVLDDVVVVARAPA